MFNDCILLEYFSLQEAKEVTRLSGVRSKADSNGFGKTQVPLLCLTSCMYAVRNIYPLKGRYLWRIWKFESVFSGRQ